MSPTPARPKSRPPTAQPCQWPAVVGKAPLAPGSTPSPEGVALTLPHERDESTTWPAPDPVIQAKRDIDAGKVDTDMQATPCLDATRRAELVPGCRRQASRKGEMIVAFYGSAPLILIGSA